MKYLFVQMIVKSNKRVFAYFENRCVCVVSSFILMQEKNFFETEMKTSEE